MNCKYSIDKSKITLSLLCEIVLEQAYEVEYWMFEYKGERWFWCYKTDSKQELLDFILDFWKLDREYVINDFIKFYRDRVTQNKHIPKLPF